MAKTKKSPGLGRKHPPPPPVKHPYLSCHGYIYGFFLTGAGGWGVPFCCEWMHLFTVFGFLSQYCHSRVAKIVPPLFRMCRIQKKNKGWSIGSRCRSSVEHPNRAIWQLFSLFCARNKDGQIHIHEFPLLKALCVVFFLHFGSCTPPPLVWTCEIQKDMSQESRTQCHGKAGQSVPDGVLVVVRLSLADSQAPELILNPQYL